MAISFDTWQKGNIEKQKASSLEAWQEENTLAQTQESLPGAGPSIPQQELPSSYSEVESEPITEDDKFQQWVTDSMAAGIIEKKPPSTMKEQLRKHLPAEGGAIAGGIALERAAARMTQNMPIQAQAIARTVGGIAGAGIGALSGEMGRQLYVNKQTGGTSTLKEMWDESQDRARYAAQDELVGQSIGGPLMMGASSLLTKIAAPSANKVIPNAAKLSKMLESASKNIPSDEIAKLPKSVQKLIETKGASLTAGQMTDSQFIDFVESMSGAAAIGGDTLNTLKNIINPAAFKQVVNESVDKMWSTAGQKMSPDELGSFALDLISGKEKEWSSLIRKSFLGNKAILRPNEAGQLAKEGMNLGREVVAEVARSRNQELSEMLAQHISPNVAFVPTDSIHKVAKKWSKIASAGEGLGDSSLIKKITDAVGKKKGKLTFEEARGFRSAILSEAEKIFKDFGRSDKVKAASGELVSAIDDALGGTLESIAPDVKDALDVANKATRDKYDLYNNPFVLKLRKTLESEPHKAVDMIFQNQSVENIKLAKDAIPEEVFSELAQVHLDKIMQTAMEDTKSIGGRMTKELKKVGVDTLTEMHGAEKTQQMFAMAEMFRSTGKSAIEHRSIKALKRLTETNPEKVMDAVIKKGGTTRYKQFRKVLGQDAMNKLNVAKWEDIISRSQSTTGEIKEPVGKAIYKHLNDLGPEMLNEMYQDKEAVASLYDIARLGELVQSPVGGGGDVVIKLLQGGAIMGTGPALTHGDAATKMTALGILVGPGAMAKLMSSRKGIKWLSEGYKIPAGSAKAKVFMGRVPGEIARLINLDKDRTPKKQKPLPSRFSRSRTY